MTQPQKLALVRKRLTAAQAATCRFLEKHEGKTVSPADASRYNRLLTAEMKVLMHLSDLEIGPTPRAIRQAAEKNRGEGK